MSPQFGSVVWDLLFDPMTDENIEIIREDCLRIVSKDPRLELRQLDVQENFDQQSITVAILLNYVPTATLTELVAVFQREIATNKIQG
jgi:phage baseplate assembly protein W